MMEDIFYLIPEVNEQKNSIVCQIMAFNVFKDHSNVWHPTKFLATYPLLSNLAILKN